MCTICSSGNRPLDDIHDMTYPLPAPIGPHVKTIHGRGCGCVRVTTIEIAASCHSWRARA